MEQFQPISANVPGNVSPEYLGPVNWGPNIAPLHHFSPVNMAPANIGPANIAPANIAPANIAPANIAPANIAPANIAPANIAPANVAPFHGMMDKGHHIPCCPCCHQPLPYGGWDGGWYW